MSNLKMYCLTLEPSHINFIESLGYTPVGLGDKKFPTIVYQIKKTRISPKRIKLW